MTAVVSQPTASDEREAAIEAEKVNYLDLYKQRCAAEGCRVNSAIVAMLRDRPHRPLQELHLSNNYVGPRGFVAVLYLIEQCQTLELVDLRGNGLDNHAVEQLCRVLERHLGVSRVRLDSNPVALDTGHALMKLLRTNRSILECTVTHTDIPPGVCDRIAMAAAENFERATGRKPALETSRPLALRPSSSQASASASQGPVQARPARLTAATPTKAGELPPRQPSAGQQTPREATTSAAMVNPGGASSYGSGQKPATNSPGRSGPSLTAPKPRPPPPALASDFHSRLTPEHRKELRERYRRRAEQYQAEAAKTESSRAAASARAELSALEAAQSRVQQARDAMATGRVPQSLNALRNPKPPQPQDSSNEASPSRADRPRAAGGRPRRPGGSPEDTPDRDLADVSVETQLPADDSQREEDGVKRPEPKKATRFVIDGETTAPGPKREPKVSEEDRPSASVTIDMPEEDITAAARGPAAAQELVVAADDHFKVLFNLGCRHYNERNLDAAYKAWTDALDLATEQRNREWMGLLTENLQGLSYEVLMAETTKHIDDGALDDAERTLALADRIAHRARKANWNAEVARVRQRVLRGQFQRYHERAEERFEHLQQYQTVEVTEDDRYEEDGVLIKHTQLYVNEWAQLLLVKEAVEGWAEAYQRGSEVGGQQGRAMQEVVDTAVAQLTSSLLEKYFAFEKETPSTLTCHYTWGLTELERAKLLDLWRDLSTKARVLRNPRWELLQAGLIGNLLFASHELRAAIEQFNTMAERAEAISDRYLLAAAKFFTGSAHFQRSSFADADAQLAFGIELLNDLRRELPDPAKPVVAASPSPGPVSLPASADFGDRLSPPVQSAGLHRALSAESSGQERATLAWPTQLMAANLHYRLYYMRSRCLANCYKAAEALENHERALVSAHCDVLYEKLSKNFNTPTRDHITCVAATMHSPLVYFAAHYRHEWDPDIENYAIREHLYIWVVPGEGAAKFTLVDVEKDHRVKSILHVLDRSRKALSVQTNSEDGSADLVSSVASHQPDDGATQTAAPSHSASATATGIQLEVPEVQWREPLRELYRILMHRVVDTISAFSQYTNQNGFVVIPHGYLWLVPFASLLNEDDRFLIEQFTVTHGLSATQLASSALSWRSASDSGSERRLVISQPEAQPSSIEPHLAFLTDTNRAEGEAADIAAQIGGELITGTPTDAVKIPATLPKARLAHISTPVLSDCAKNMMSGGIAATTSYDQLGILHSTEIAFLRIRAEVVVHTNVNVSREQAMTSMHEGSLGWMRALLGCGVTSCIFPLWCTPDMMPVDFASLLYDELERTGNHKARAVANVMRHMLHSEHRAHSSPRFWAPYVVLGFPPGLERARTVPKPARKLREALSHAEEQQKDQPVTADDMAQVLRKASSSTAAGGDSRRASGPTGPSGASSRKSSEASGRAPAAESEEAEEEEESEEHDEERDAAEDDASQPAEDAPSDPQR